MRKLKNLHVEWEHGWFANCPRVMVSSERPSWLTSTSEEWRSFGLRKQWLMHH